MTVAATIDFEHKAGPVRAPKDQVSEITGWMLAVRDQRSRSSFESLFDHFAPRLKGFALRSGHSAAVAEDMVQDVMLTIWNKADQYDPTRAPVSGWIYQIARNKLIDHVRKARRPLPEEHAEDNVSDVDASQILEADQEYGRLRDALHCLSFEQRDIIERAYLGELTHKEISHVTGIPLGTIKSRIRLALQRLRYELADLR